MTPDHAKLPRPTPLFIGSIAKGAYLLHVFAVEASPHGLSLTDVATIARIDKSLAQRLLNTLWRLGLLHKERATRRYTIANPALADAFKQIAASGASVLDLTAATPARGDAIASCVSSLNSPAVAPSQDGVAAGSFGSAP
jgi:hypothetical protein